MIRAPSSGRRTSNSTLVPQEIMPVFFQVSEVWLHELRKLVVFCPGLSCQCCFTWQKAEQQQQMLLESLCSSYDRTLSFSCTHTHTHMLFFFSHQCSFLLQIRLCFRGPTSCKIHFNNVVSNNNTHVCPVEKQPLFLLHWRAVWKTDPRTGPLMMQWRCVFACRPLKPLHSLELRRCWGSSRAPLTPTPLHSQHPLLDANADLNYLLLCLS